MTVTDVPGFVASGLACGVKPSGDPDMAMVATADGRPVTAVGVFTSNKMTAAPVRVCREHLAGTGGRAAAVVINSGNANAATGAQGMADAEAMCALTAAELGCEPEEVLVCSTGWIGYGLPMDAISAGIPRLASSLDPGGGPAAATTRGEREGGERGGQRQAEGATQGGARGDGGHDVPFTVRGTRAEAGRARRDRVRDPGARPVPVGRGTALGTVSASTVIFHTVGMPRGTARIRGVRRRLAGRPRAWKRFHRAPGRGVG